MYARSPLGFCLVLRFPAFPYYYYYYYYYFIFASQHDPHGMEPAAAVFYPHTWLAMVLLKVSATPASLVWLAPVCGSQWIKVPAAKEHALDRSKTLGAVLLLELRKPLLPLAVVRPWSNLFASVVLCNYCRFLCVLRCHEAHAIFVGLRDARRSGPGDRVLLRASEDNGRWRAGRAPWPDG